MTPPTLVTRWLHSNMCLNATVAGTVYGGGIGGIVGYSNDARNIMVPTSKRVANIFTAASLGAFIGCCLGVALPLSLSAVAWSEYAAARTTTVNNKAKDCV